MEADLILKALEMSLNRLAVSVTKFSKEISAILENSLSEGSLKLMSLFTLCPNLS